MLSIAEHSHCKCISDSDSSNSGAIEAGRAYEIMLGANEVPKSSFGRYNNEPGACSLSNAMDAGVVKLFAIPAIINEVGLSLNADNTDTIGR